MTLEEQQAYTAIAMKHLANVLELIHSHLEPLTQAELDVVNEAVSVCRCMSLVTGSLRDDPIVEHFEQQLKLGFVAC